MKISRQQKWNIEYKTKRYMKNLNDKEFTEKINEVMKSMFYTTVDGKIGIEMDDSLKKWSNCQLECELRGKSFIDYIDREKMKKHVNWLLDK